MVLDLALQIERIIGDIDAQIGMCCYIDLDSAYLVDAKRALMSYRDEVEKSLLYKMELYEYYGTPLEEEDIESVKALTEEIGYDHVRSLFGESVDAVLSEAAEEASYSG